MYVNIEVLFWYYVSKYLSIMMVLCMLILKYYSGIMYVNIKEL